MKKSILILTVLLFLFTGCTDGGQAPAGSTAETTAPAETEFTLEMDGDTYVITEEHYLEGVQEIYNDPDKYVGKRVQIEGQYIAELYVDEMYYQVYRYVTVTEHHEDEEGHVHTQASESYPIGFRFKYDGNKPTNGTFVRLAGVVEEYESDGEKLLLIRADTLEKCETPGKVSLYY